MVGFRVFRGWGGGHTNTRSGAGGLNPTDTPEEQTSRLPGFEAYGQRLATPGCSTCLMAPPGRREDQEPVSIEQPALHPHLTRAQGALVESEALRAQRHTDPPGIFLLDGGAGNSLPLTHS